MTAYLRVVHTTTNRYSIGYGQSDHLFSDLIAGKRVEEKGDSCNFAVIR